MFPARHIFVRPLPGSAPLQVQRRAVHVRRQRRRLQASHVERQPGLIGAFNGSSFARRP